MGTLISILNRIVTAIFLIGISAAPIHADEARLDQLFEQLQTPDLPNWKMVEEAIWAEWSKSGSPTLDLLLTRGRDAMEEGDFTTAIEHLTALTDHAPDFAEGYNARASAYFRDGRYGPALEDIRRALALNPRHFGAMVGLGTIMDELNNPELALRAYNAAYALNPHDTELKDAIARLEKKVSGVTL